MIRALVVDDEKRVRQGFLALTDWTAHGIQFIGEAKDGHSTLAFLEKHGVDLLFVDISMPGMNGFELISRVRDLYPDIRSVILTCHHEFDYVQEALRLGAIDYIVKTLISPDNAEQSIHRIVNRLAREGRPPATVRLFHAGACFWASSPGADPEALRLALPPERQLIQLREGLWLVPLAENDSANWMRDLPGTISAFWQAVNVVSSEGCPQEEARLVLSRHLHNYLFYTSPPACSTVRLEHLQSHQNATQFQLNEAIVDWAQGRWLLYGEEWKRFIGQVEQMRPSLDRLLPLLQSILENELAYFRWNRPSEIDQEAGRDEAPYSWNSWKINLMQAVLHVQQRLTETAISREVAGSLFRAVRYMKENVGSDLNQEAVAHHVGMSRSYFSQCFKRFIGFTFTDTIRDIQIGRAKALLRDTGLSVYDIASRAGFEDDKYFSRVFRDHTGQLPTEFRAEAARGQGGI